jgi:hypothetical protein
VSIAVGWHTDEGGQLLLTPQLMTDREIDEAVDGLIKELEEFRKAAKKELMTLRARMLAK